MRKYILKIIVINEIFENDHQILHTDMDEEEIKIESNNDLMNPKNYGNLWEFIKTKSDSIKNLFGNRIFKVKFNLEYINDNCILGVFIHRFPDGGIFKSKVWIEDMNELPNYDEIVKDYLDKLDSIL